MLQEKKSTIVAIQVFLVGVGLTLFYLGNDLFLDCVSGNNMDVSAFPQRHLNSLVTFVLASVVFALFVAILVRRAKWRKAPPSKRRGWSACLFAFVFVLLYDGFSVVSMGVGLSAVVAFWLVVWSFILALAARGLFHDNAWLQ